MEGLKFISNIAKQYLLLIIILIYSTNAYAETRGKVLISEKFQSEKLNSEVKYSIYLPVGYEESSENYPVLYLLHGYTDNENTWIDMGWVDYASDLRALQNKNDKMIIVMPDGGLQWYLNHPNGKNNYEDMFVTEFIDYIDTNYKTIPRREKRAIGGLSMGGFGALLYSMKYEKIFSACIAFSSAIRSDITIINLEQERFDYLYLPLYGKNIVGANRLSNHWTSNNPLNLAASISNEKLSNTSWYLSCGDDDILLPGNILLHNIFVEKNIEHEFIVDNGGHNWDYWRKHINEGLEFLSSVFNANKDENEK